MKKLILALALILSASVSFAQTSRQIQSSDVTGALGYTPLRSIGGMTGPAIICGTGLTCAGNTISSPPPAFTPGGTNGQIQYNNSGAFGGFTASGDASINTGTGALTLATVNANVGVFGSSTSCVSFTTNGKGLITAASATTCTPNIASITGLGTNVATALAVNVGTAGAFVVNGGALGTPASGVATNLTGTAAGLTAGTFSAGSATNLTSGTLPAARTNGHMNGTATNDNAAAGEVGEYIESVVASGSAISVVTTTPKTIASITLTAGDWDVRGLMNGLTTNASTSVSGYGASVSLTTNALDTTAGRFSQVLSGAFVPGNSATVGVPIPSIRFSVTSSTTIYFVAYMTFTVSTMSAYGTISARRVR